MLPKSQPTKYFKKIYFILKLRNDSKTIKLIEFKKIGLYSAVEKIIINSQFAISLHSTVQNF